MALNAAVTAFSASQTSLSLVRGLSYAAARASAAAPHPAADSLRSLIWGAAGERPADLARVHYHYELPHDHHHAPCGTDGARGAIQRCAARLATRLAPGTPASLQGALQPSGQARVVAELEWPHRVVHVSAAFEALSGWASRDARGAPLPELFRGPETDPAAETRIEAAAAARARTTVPCAAYVRGGRGGRPAALQLSPLYGENGAVSHLLAVVTPLEGEAAANQAAAL